MTAKTIRADRSIESATTIAQIDAEVVRCCDEARKAHDARKWALASAWHSRAGLANYQRDRIARA